MKRLFKIGLFAAILVTFTGTLHAEEGLEEVWYKEGTPPPSEYARAVSATSDGGYVVSGQTREDLLNQTVASQEGYIGKYNSSGEVEWQKAYGSLGGHELWDVIQTSDGGYIAAGYSLSNMPLNNGDGFLVKVNKDGNVEWSYCSNYQYFDIFHKVVELDDGSFMVTGEASRDVNVVKFDKNGNLLSENHYDVDGGSVNNFTGSTVTTRGTVLISGSVDSPASTIGRILFVTEVDKDGNELSTKLYPSTTRNFSNFTSINATSDGGFIYSTVESGLDANSNRVIYSMIVKCNATGDVVWEREYVGVSVRNIVATSSGYAFAAETGDMSGYTSQFIMTDSEGKDIATYDITSNSGSEIYGNIVKGSDGSYIMVEIRNGSEQAMKFKITSEEDTIVTPPVDNNQGQNNNQNQGSNQTQNGVNTANSGGNTTSSNAVAPATGDTTNVVLLISLALLSVLTINKLKVKKY